MDAAALARDGQGVGKHTQLSPHFFTRLHLADTS